MDELERLEQEAARLAGCFEGYSMVSRLPPPMVRFRALWPSERQKYLDMALRQRTTTKDATP